MAALSRLGDAMLSRLLPEVQAGACVPEHGQKCKCAAPCGTSWCTQYYVSCTGPCTDKSGRC